MRIEKCTDVNGLEVGDLESSLGGHLICEVALQASIYMSSYMVSAGLAIQARSMRARGNFTHNDGASCNYTNINKPMDWPKQPKCEAEGSGNVCPDRTPTPMFRYKYLAR